MRQLSPQIVSLIHYAELNREGWQNVAVDRYVIAVMWLLNDAVHIQQVKKAIVDSIYLDLQTREIRQSLVRLEATGDIVRLHDGRYKVTEQMRSKFQQNIGETLVLEERIRAKFYTLLQLCPDIDKSITWAMFTEHFLKSVVNDMGAKIYEFFTQKGDDKNWSAYMDSFLEHIPQKHREDVTKVVYSFLDPNDSEVARYMFIYLDAYLLIASSGLPHSSIRNIENSKKLGVEFVVFVDTNFIYSALELHFNPDNEAVSALMKQIQPSTSQIKINLVVSPITLEETRKSLRHHREELDNSTYSPNLAEAALRSGVSGVTRRFFERIVEIGRSLNAADYFRPYEDNINRILEEKGIEIYQDPNIYSYKDDLDIIDEIERQVANEKINRENPRTRRQITHDVTLWHFVYHQRDLNIDSPLDIKFWIVTVDRRLIRLDRSKSGYLQKPRVCMDPAQFSQILRLFIPRSTEFEKAVLGAMRLPVLMRSFDPKAEQITAQILRQLSRYEAIEDLSPSVITAVITDQVLRTRLAMSSADEKEGEIVSEALALKIVEQDNLIRDQSLQMTDLKEQVDSIGQQREADLQANKDLREQLNQLEKWREEEQRKSRSEQDALTRKNEIRLFVFTNLLLIIPYVTILAFGWIYFPTLVSSTTGLPLPVIYLLGLVLTLILGIILARAILFIGNSNTIIEREELFQRFKKGFVASNIIIAIASLAWGLFWEFISKLLLP